MINSYFGGGKCGDGCSCGLYLGGGEGCGCGKVGGEGGCGCG